MRHYFLIAGLIVVLFTAGCDKDTAVEPNNFPYIPGSPFPSSGATGLPTDVDLSWSGGDPDGDPVIYDLYFGTKSSPPLLTFGLAQTNYDPGLLNEDTQYYWKIISMDGRGAETPGPVWMFRTGSGAEEGNVVEIESVYVNTGLQVVVQVFFQNSVELGGVTVPVQYSSTDVVCDSVSFDGSRLDYLGMKGSNIDLANRLVMAYGVVLLESYVPVGSGLLCKIYFTIPHPVNTVVEIVSAFYPPSNSLVFVDSSADSITPQFIPGKIVIDTQ